MLAADGIPANRIARELGVGSPVIVKVLHGYYESGYRDDNLLGNSVDRDGHDRKGNVE
jgi:hypothetical protein